MSEFLVNVLRKELAINDLEEKLLTTSIREMPRNQRKQLYSLLKERPEITAYLEEQWAGGDASLKETWTTQTAASIVDRTGDRDTLDKIAGQLIGNIRTYNRVQQLCDERKVILKTSASSGGCTTLLIIATIIVGLVLIILKGF